MLFKLSSADASNTEKRASPAPQIKPARLVDINDLSPAEWAVMRIVDEEKKQRPAAAAPPAEIIAGRIRRLAVRQSLLSDRSGASAVEFALVAPVFLLLACGIVVYGVWFSMALSVQSLATESARASLAGIDVDERRSLATTFIETQAKSAGLAGPNLSENVDIANGVTRVTVRFNAADHPIMAMKGLIPSPPTVIERTAVVESDG